MKYHIKTFGCQMNFSDSERMATFFEENDFEPTDKINQADLVMFNTCGVRQMSEDRVYGQVHNVYKKNPEKIVVITGCLAHREDFKKRLEKKVDLFVAIKDFPNILKLLKSNNNPKINKFFHSLENERKKINSNKNKHYNTTAYCSEKSDDVLDKSNFYHSSVNGRKNKYLEINPKYERKDSALVPIMTGCNNFCSYCIVPYARGREWSRPFEKIQKEIMDLCNDTCNDICKDITLLGQNVNSYKDGKTTFPILLDTLAKKFPKTKFNFLTSHPKDFSDELIEVIANNKNISREIHLPVQAGSDKILKAMNRPYTQKHYLDLIKKTKKRIPEAKFSTDVIVGFPGETEKDFQESVKVFKEVGFFEAYVNKYSPRPGTASFKLKDDISWEEKKRREKELKKYF